MQISAVLASSRSHSLLRRRPAPRKCIYALPLPPPRVLKPLGEPSKLLGGPSEFVWHVV